MAHNTIFNLIQLQGLIFGFSTLIELNIGCREGPVPQCLYSLTTSYLILQGIPYIHQYTPFTYSLPQAPFNTGEYRTHSIFKIFIILIYFYFHAISLSIWLLAGMENFFSQGLSLLHLRSLQLCDPQDSYAVIYLQAIEGVVTLESNALQNCPVQCITVYLATLILL